MAFTVIIIDGDKAYVGAFPSTVQCCEPPSSRHQNLQQIVVQSWQNGLEKLSQKGNKNPMIRRYAAADFEELYRVEQLCFLPPLRFSRALMRELTASPFGECWLDVGAEKEIRGFVVMGYEREDAQLAAYLHTLEVLPEHRKQGIATALLAQAEDSARKAGAAIVWLHVEEGNLTAIRRYEAQGFAACGREEDYYPDKKSALVYLKRLPHGD